MSAAEWVSRALGRELTEFQARAVNLLCRAWGCGPYDMGRAFETADWNYGRGVSFVVYAGGGLATFDFSQLTALVLGAHDECIRVDVSPRSFKHLRISMWPRERDGRMHQRHPTIEQAVAAFRGASRARPLAEYDEDLGSVLWWAFPVAEPPYVGKPYDSDWPGYHTHWTPLEVPTAPAGSDA